jgi:hypothetical protein
MAAYVKQIPLRIRQRGNGAKTRGLTMSRAMSHRVSACYGRIGSRI